MRNRARRWRSLRMGAGLAVIAIAAGVVSGFAARAHTFTVHQLTAHWHAPYDLVVFPKGQRAGAGLVDPNALDTGSGGITMAQYQQIQHIPGVAVAAPLAPVGYIRVHLGTVPLVEQFHSGQLYRLTEQDLNQGLPNGQVETEYTLLGNRISVPGFGPFVLSEPPVAALSTEVLLMAVNPTAEAKLMGLARAVVSGQYFTRADQKPHAHIEAVVQGTATVYTIPILLTTVSPQGGRFTARVQLLAVPPSLRSLVARRARSIVLPGNGGPLASLSGPVVGRVSVSDAAIWRDVVATFQGQPLTSIDGHSVNVAGSGHFTAIDFPMLVSAPLQVKSVGSPVSDRWPMARLVVPVGGDSRQWDTFGEPFRSVRQERPASFVLDPVGFYDPAHLAVVDDPLTHLPLVGYRPEMGREVLSPRGVALNPPRLVLPDGSPAGLWTAPPEALTPLGAVTPLLGPAPISSIRVKVAGVRHFGISAETQLSRVATAITRATGLPVTIVRGASPEQVLLHPGHLPGFPSLGWIATDWVRVGASIEILRQVTLSQGVMLGPVLVAAALYAGISAWLDVAGDRRRWAVALAVGVSPGVIWRQLVRRAGMQGIGVAVLAILTAGIIGHIPALTLAVPVGLTAALVVTGAMWPAARMVARQDPVKGLKADPPPGLVRMRIVTGGHLGLALAVAAWRRVGIALGALVLPAAVCYGVGLVQIAWHDTLHVTILGQYLLVHGGWLMTAAALVTTGLTAVTAAEIAAAAAEARRGTWAVGAALGWRANVAWGGMAAEAGLLGLLAGGAGTGLAILALSPLFGVPVVWGMAGAVVLGISVVSELAALPAVWAVRRQDPVEVFKGGRS